MSTCEQCPLRDGCIERRGICRDYLQYMERVERTRRQIEQLNEDQKKASGRTRADKGGIQKAGDRRGKVYQGTPKRVQAKAGTDPKEDSETETEEKADQGIQTRGTPAAEVLVCGKGAGAGRALPGRHDD